MRIGHGYDVHRLVEGRDLILGGVKIDYEKGLDGHSDADVLFHAVSDALLGAAALGDIGLHFPDTSADFAGIDSKILLRRVAEPEEIARPIVFLCSGAASYITATSLEVSGGRSVVLNPEYAYENE